MERGCVESDEISRSNGTEPLSCGDRASDRRKAEAMHELVESGLTPLCRPPASLQHALEIGHSEMEDVPYGTYLRFGNSICSVRNISGDWTF